MIEDRRSKKDLEEELALMKKDPFIGFYFSQIRKLNEFTDASNACKISSLQDDNVDLCLKMAEKSSAIINNIITLEKIIKERFGVNEIKEGDTRTGNVMEDLLKEIQPKKK